MWNLTKFVFISADLTFEVFEVLLTPFQNNFQYKKQVSLLGVDALWGDCTFIPADWRS